MTETGTACDWMREEGRGGERRREEEMRRRELEEQGKRIAKRFKSNEVLFVLTLAKPLL